MCPFPFQSTELGGQAPQSCHSGLRRDYRERTWGGGTRGELERPAVKEGQLRLLETTQGRQQGGGQTLWLAPLWAAEGREGRLGDLLRDPTFPIPSQGRVEYRGPGRCQSPALLQAVPTSRSPCPTLEEARGLQSLDEIPTLLGPLQSAISLLLK